MRSHLGKLLAYSSGTAAPCADPAAGDQQPPHNGDFMLVSVHHNHQQPPQAEGEQQEYQQEDGAFHAAAGGGAAYGDGCHGGGTYGGAADADMEGAAHCGADGKLGEGYPQGKGAAGDGGQDQHMRSAQEAVPQDAGTAYDQDR